MENGQLQVYTGDGKGKTTAAIGLAVRARGAGLRVYFGQFMKAEPSSEHAALEGLGIKIEQFGSGKGLLIRRKADGDDIACARLGLEQVRAAMTGGAYDVVVADEINCAMACGLLQESDLLALADARPEGVELVFTGRGATEAILDRADLATEMRPIKHYYRDKGLAARVGIEK